MKHFLLTVGLLTSMNAFAGGPSVKPEVWTTMSNETERVVFLLSQYCLEALNDVKKSGAYIGTTSINGDFYSEDYTIKFSAFRQVDFFHSESAGEITLKATKIEDPPADASSIAYECSYSK
jgi:hypothetical protein